MRSYVIRRLLLAIPTLLGVAAVTVLMTHALHGFEQTIMMCGLCPSFEEQIRWYEEHGFNKPLYVQYFDRLLSTLTLDFGKSFIYDVDVTDLLARKGPLSLQVGLMGLIIGSVLGISGGVITALKQDSLYDYLIRGLAILGISVPTFWSGMMLILILVRAFNWIPEQGYTPLWEDPLANLTQLIWPALIIGLGFLMGASLRLMRASLLEVMREDYIRTARAKGLQERVIIVRHAMRNALIPVLTLIGTFLPITLTGLVVTEQVFGLPGVGSMLLDALRTRDIPVVQMVVTLTGFTVIFANLGVDLLYGWLDPRIRY